MMKRAFLLGSLAILLGLGVTSSASADTITFSLATSGCSSGCNVLPAGTITVTDVAAGEVQIQLQLVSDYSLRDANDPNHHTLAFNLSGVTGASIEAGSLSSGAGTLPSNPSGSPQTFVLSTGSVNDSPFGSFNTIVTCTTCSIGVPGTPTQWLQFDLLGTGLSTASFSNIAVDVVGLDQAAGVGQTGNIGATGGTRTIQTGVTPEPSSLMLLGTGLTAIGGLVRRKMAA